jgi:hypothetical protein
MYSFLEHKLTKNNFYLRVNFGEQINGQLVELLFRSTDRLEIQFVAVNFDFGILAILKTNRKEDEGRSLRPCYHWWMRPIIKNACFKSKFFIIIFVFLQIIEVDFHNISEGRLGRR